MRTAEEGGGRRPGVCGIFMDDAISVEVQWDGEGARCLDLTRPLAFIQEQAMSEISEGEEPLLSRKKVTGWATQQEFLGYDIDTESMTIALPTRKVDDLRET